jgi:PPP family 3-phenylpropionic acid transporter
LSARGLLSVYWFLLFAALGVFFPFYSLYLDENAGLTGTQVGLVMASVPLTGMIAQPLWGLAADRSGRRARLLTVLTACSAVGYAALYWALDFTSLLTGTMLLSIFSTAVIPLCISVCFSLLSESGPHAFGQTLRTGGWVGRTMPGASEPGLEVMLPVTALLTMLAAGVAAFLPDRPIDHGHRMRAGEWRILFAHGPFLRFLLFIVGAYLFLQGPTALFPLFIRSLGGDMNSVSYLWVLMVALEIPLVAYSAAGFARLGPRVLLAIGIGCGALRWLVSGLAEDWRVIYAVQALHGVTVGGLIIGAPYYVDAIVPPRLKSTAQGILSMAGVSLGGILSNLLTGTLIDHFGARAPAILGGAGALLLTFLLPAMVARTANAIMPETVLAEPLSAEPLA